MWYLEKTLSEKAADTSIFSLRALSVSLENLFGKNIRRMFIPACRSRVTGMLDQYQGQTLDIYFNALLENIRAFKFFLETSSKADVDVAYLHKDSVPEQLHERIADLKSLKRKILKGDYETDKEKNLLKLIKRFYARIVNTKSVPNIKTTVHYKNLRAKLNMLNTISGDYIKIKSQKLDEKLSDLK